MHWTCNSSLELYKTYSTSLAATVHQMYNHMKSSDAKASKCHLKFCTLMMIFIKLVYLSSVISLK